MTYYMHYDAAGPKGWLAALATSKDLIPVGRLGTVDEVADVVVMLAGNGYIAGQTINVNGGWYMS